MHCSEPRHDSDVEMAHHFLSLSFMFFSSLLFQKTVLCIIVNPASTLTFKLIAPVPSLSRQLQQQALVRERNAIVHLCFAHTNVEPWWGHATCRYMLCICPKTKCVICQNKHKYEPLYRGKSLLLCVCLLLLLFYVAHLGSSLCMLYDTPLLS